MKNRTVFAIGETILDIIFDQNNAIVAKAGGSMLNTSISLSRANIPVEFISEIGSDDPGNFISQFIASEGINTSCLDRFTEGQTPIALAFLDHKKDAHYTFYKKYPDKRLQVKIPNIGSNDILLFGSSYAINLQVRKQLIGILEAAKQKNATIIYDPNYRKSSKQDLKKQLPLVVENMKYATLIRGSNEDFYHLFGCEEAEAAYRHIKPFCSNLIYTQSDVDVHLFANGLHKKYYPPKIELKSSIGAGDNFNAGLIHLLYQLKIPFHKLSATDFDLLINNSMKFASNVCTSKDNYISREFASTL